MDGGSPGLQQDFEAFHARFTGLFGRSEPRALCATYLRGLMAKVERRNCWQLAEATGEPLPDAMQRLLYRTHWDADAARDILQDFVCEQFGEAEGHAGRLRCGSEFAPTPCREPVRRRRTGR
jgi:SRSO17 transposase